MGLAAVMHALAHGQLRLHARAATSELLSTTVSQRRRLWLGHQARIRGIFASGGIGVAGGSGIVAWKLLKLGPALSSVAAPQLNASTIDAAVKGAQARLVVNLWLRLVWQRLVWLRLMIVRLISLLPSRRLVRGASPQKQQKELSFRLHCEGRRQGEGRHQRQGHEQRGRGRGPSSV